MLPMLEGAPVPVMTMPLLLPAQLGSRALQSHSRDIRTHLFDARDGARLRPMQRRLHGAIDGTLQRQRDRDSVSVYRKALSECTPVCARLSGEWG